MGVSIIISYHRGEQYLRDCLDSICDLKLQDYEVILIHDQRKMYEDLIWNNPSLPKKVIEGLQEDGFDRILQTYQKQLPIMDFVWSEEAGIGAIRNAGLEKATKEYVYFLDSDDYLLPEGLEQMSRLAEEEEATVVYSEKIQTRYKRFTYLKEGKQLENTEQQENTHQQVNAEQQEKIYQQEELDLLESDSRNAKKQEKERANKRQHIVYEIHDAAAMLFEKEVSVLNLLIKREWIKEHKIQFDGENLWYSDLPFVMQLLAASTKEDRWVWSSVPAYGKREHNDPVLQPSLSQIKVDDRGGQFLAAVVRAKQIVLQIPETEGDTKVAQCKKQVLEVLYKYACRFYLQLYMGNYHGKKDSVLSETTVEAVAMFLQDMDKHILLNFTVTERGILEAIQNREWKKAVKKANRFIMKKKKKGLFGNTIQRARALDRLLFRRLSIKKNLILFESFGGKSYSDNCKYIYEYLLETYGDAYKYVWVMRDKQVVIPGNPTVIQPNTYRYLYYLSRAKFLVFNSRQPIWYTKRKGSVFIETWHGTPLKKLVFDMEDVHSASSTHKEDFYKVSRKWDYLLSDNRFSTEVFEHAFLFDQEKILEYGYPRNDVLYAKNGTEIGKKVKQKLGIPLDKKVILYAPTWRDDEFYSNGKYKFSLALDIEKLKEAFSDEYVLLLRTHYFVVDQVDSICGDGFVYNGSRYQDVSELYLASDLCITDYSSVFFDYANLRRPILFFTYDLEKYREELHGFYIDMETEVPGPLLQTNEELIKAIAEIDEIEEQYKERYNRFYERFCSIEDGHAAQRVVENIIRKG
ncbi:bifunctional glycosyltransferase/CDP-glycerol:glycerophosphate glycerophosphotransferase [Anaerosporobacter faecicola]|uniref:bifunctional glycosyltransferase/CDP-glycerol:glycerophosphate glycerophosphotransferase n=1 Tax=Anaerosporobacter faecicola TaxID=2718714 RepID=UPI00143B52C4|nr:bifunctional glycosyltransferase family 2 protein/CDP-glycerol:glycerophosphate glycerophosphotransferase [Anaerosporobacter faecicola]